MGEKVKGDEEEAPQRPSKKSHLAMATIYLLIVPSAKSSWYRPMMEDVASWRCLFSVSHLTLAEWLLELLLIILSFLSGRGGGCEAVGGASVSVSLLLLLLHEYVHTDSSSFVCVFLFLLFFFSNTLSS